MRQKIENQASCDLTLKLWLKTKEPETETTGLKWEKAGVSVTRKRCFKETVLHCLSCFSENEEEWGGRRGVGWVGHEELVLDPGQQFPKPDGRPGVGERVYNLKRQLEQHVSLVPLNFYRGVNS